MKHFIIIGCGTAAIGCVEGIRSIDKESKISIIAREGYSAYCRPLISYFLEDKTNEEKMKYRSDDFYINNHCSLFFNTSATKIDEKNKLVYLDNNSELSYDSLCVATGSSPFVPPMENIDKVLNKTSFLTLDDAKRLKKMVKKNSRVLIIGAGLIGLKCAEGLRKITENITVCDLSDHILSSILDSDDASIVQEHIEKNGITFSLGNSVKSFVNNSAIMQNGEIVEFDVLVTAVGVRANISLVKEAGGLCNRGIVVNDKMMSTLFDVYAVGDCSESWDISDESQKVMALMPNAYIQGFTAGVNMAGGERVFDNAIPMNSIGFFGYHLMTAGSRKGELIEEKNGEDVKRLFFSKDRLIGFVLLGNVKNAGIYTSFIRDKIKVDETIKKAMLNEPDMSLYDDEMRRKILRK